MWRLKRHMKTFLVLWPQDCVVLSRSVSHIAPGMTGQPDHATIIVTSYLQRIRDVCQRLEARVWHSGSTIVMRGHIAAACARSASSLSNAVPCTWRRAVTLRTGSRAHLSCLSCACGICSPVQSQHVDDIKALLSLSMRAPAAGLFVRAARATSRSPARSRGNRGPDR